MNPKPNSHKHHHIHITNHKRKWLLYPLLCETQQPHQPHKYVREKFYLFFLWIICSTHLKSLMPCITIKKSFSYFPRSTISVHLSKCWNGKSQLPTECRINRNIEHRARQPFVKYQNEEIHMKHLKCSNLNRIYAFEQRRREINEISVKSIRWMSIGNI